MDFAASRYTFFVGSSRPLRHDPRRDPSGRPGGTMSDPTPRPTVTPPLPARADPPTPLRPGEVSHVSDGVRTCPQPYPARGGHGTPRHATVPPAGDPTTSPSPVVPSRARTGPPRACTHARGRTPSHVHTRTRTYTHVRPCTHGEGACHNRTPGNARGRTLCPRRMSCTSSEEKCLRIKGNGQERDVRGLGRMSSPPSRPEGGGRGMSPPVLGDHDGVAPDRRSPEGPAHSPASHTMRPSDPMAYPGSPSYASGTYITRPPRQR